LFQRGILRERCPGGGDGAGKKRGECAAVDHGFLSCRCFRVPHWVHDERIVASVFPIQKLVCRPVSS
jgi:hypothetical protein